MTTKRKKLMAKIKRIAENLGIDENFAAAVREHLKKTGQIPASEPGEAERPEADPAGSADFMGEVNAPEATPTEAQPGSGFCYSNWP